MQPVTPRIRKISESGFPFLLGGRPSTCLSLRVIHLLPLKKRLSEPLKKYYQILLFGLDLGNEVRYSLSMFNFYLPQLEPLNPEIFSPCFYPMLCTQPPIATRSPP